MFPSLVNCCTIDWFMPWPEEALISVAKDSLKEVVDSNLVESISLICYTLHSVSILNIFSVIKFHLDKSMGITIS